MAGEINVFPKDSELPKPFSESILEYNVKPRLVYCPICHYETITDLCGPKCGHCQSRLITKIEQK
jgi:hypothetical protein